MRQNAIRMAACVAAVATFALAGIIAADRLSDEPQERPVAARGGLPPGTSVTLNTRGSWRVLSVEDSSPDGSVAVPLAAGQEMLVSRVVIQNGRFLDGTAETGGVAVTLATSDEPGEPMFTYFPFSAYGAQEFTMDPPMPLRAGDEVRFTYSTAAAPVGFIQVRFVGEAIPPTALVAR